MKTNRVVIVFTVLILLAGCADLVVRNIEVNWDENRKIARAQIANVGNRDAGEFFVYFDADENPISQNHRPQDRHLVSGLAAGSAIELVTDFTSLAHPDNQELANVVQITVIVDPKMMLTEKNEDNNTRSAPIPPPPLVDAHNLVSAGNIVVDNNQWGGQTFTMIQSGRLLGIEVAAVRCNATTEDQLTLEVGQGMTVFGNMAIPGSELLGPGLCGVVPAPLALGTSGTGYFDLSPLNRSLIMGQTYYFKLTSNTSPNRDFRLGLSADVYSGGTINVNGNTSVGDLAFKIVIQP
jgi:hypothetical protein